MTEADPWRKAALQRQYNRIRSEVRTLWEQERLDHMDVLSLKEILQDLGINPKTPVLNNDREHEFYEEAARKIERELCHLKQVSTYYVAKAILKAKPERAKVVLDDMVDEGRLAKVSTGKRYLYVRVSSA